MGNVDGVLLKSEDKGRNAYNEKLLKYNSKFAQLVGKQKSNIDAIENILEGLPTVKFMDLLRRDIKDLDEKQKSFRQHFEELKITIN